MSFFKKLFGSKKTKSSNTPDSSDRFNTSQDISPRRRKSLTTCQSARFKPSSSLPWELDRAMRPKLEIALRLHAIKAMVLWLLVPESNLPSDKIIAYIEQNKLQEMMTADEKQILGMVRDDEQARNAIGWKFENAWPLAWYFGFNQPEIMGQMMSGEMMQDILMNHTCKLDVSIAEWTENKSTVTDEEAYQLEDTFYCLHNAVRSAQLGGDTVPQGFDPVGNGGVIHERRHALTWMVSNGISWEETDLST